MVKEIKSERLNERYYKMIHSSGLTVLLYPMTVSYTHLDVYKRQHIWVLLTVRWN